MGIIKEADIVAWMANDCSVFCDECVSNEELDVNLIVHPKTDNDFDNDVMVYCDNCGKLILDNITQG